MNYRMLGAFATGANLGTAAAAFHNQDLFWMIIAELWTLVAFFCYSFALSDQRESEIATLRELGLMLDNAKVAADEVQSSLINLVKRENTTYPATANRKVEAR